MFKLKRVLYGFIFCVFFLSSFACSDLPPSPHVTLDKEGIKGAFEQKRSGIMVESYGRVVRLLPDDEKGSRHQRFILKLSHGQTLLISHNIDLAPKIKRLKIGDMVAFRGEYEWNEKGGLVHWTHHDPRGKHPGGWLMHKKKTYQ